MTRPSKPKGVNPPEIALSTVFHEKDAMDRNILSAVGFAVIWASAAAQTHTPVAHHAADTASVIMAPGSAGSIQLLPPGPETGHKQRTTSEEGSSVPKPPGRENATSSHISQIILAGLPNFRPAPAGKVQGVEGIKTGGRLPLSNSGVAMLPAFIVRDSKVPSADQILTGEARGKIAMDRYLGPSDGLDRGVLNRYTLKQLWAKIPILRALPVEFVGAPVSMTNEDRGYDAGGANDTIPYPHPPPKVKDGSDE